MADEVKRYQRSDKNQVKLDWLSSVIEGKVKAWLKEKQTGRLTLSVDISAKDGGLGDAHMEQTEKSKVF